MSSYWEKYWNNVNQEADAQCQVGRTYKKEPIKKNIWEMTLEFVEKQMQLDAESVLLDLCCGNGAFSIPIAKKISHVVSIDFSEPLLSVLKSECKKQHVSNITTCLSDILNFTMDFEKTKISHILIYFALQHLTEREALLLFEKMSKIVDIGGLFYIGDIPDRLNLWTFANTEEYEKMYFDSVKNETPAIGTWFIADDLCKMARYAGFASAEIIEQPEYQINSRYRFDLKLIK